jgi:hypothetical protein
MVIVPLFIGIAKEQLASQAGCTTTLISTRLLYYNWLSVTALLRRHKPVLLKIIGTAGFRGWLHHNIALY